MNSPVSIPIAIPDSDGGLGLHLPFPPLENPREKVLAFIESTLSRVVRDIQFRPSGRPSIALRRITDVKISVNPTTQEVKREIVDREVTYSFPGKNKDEAWRFACVGKILAETYAAIKTGVTITKRDVYYRDPSLFKKQATVDRYIDDIAYTCRVTRRDLNVTASTRGLVAGLLFPSLKPSLSPENERSFDTILDLEDNFQNSSLAHIKWILIVEKEATFKELVEKGFHRSLMLGKGLLVTGKGYPDLASRRFLRDCIDHSSWADTTPPPLFGLFDCDPDGISIMQIYRLGSRALAHEQACSVPEMKWLGVNLDDMLGGVSDDSAVLKLSSRDRDKARSTLGKLVMYEDRVQRECFAELQRMLVLNVKAEIQILEERQGGLDRWLEGKIRRELSFGI